MGGYVGWVINELILLLMDGFNGRDRKVQQ